MNRKPSGESLPRDEAYRAAKIILQEAVEDWEELKEDQRKTALSLPIHRAADGNLVPLLDCINDETDFNDIPELFYLQSEDDLKDAPITLPDRRLLNVDKKTYSFYREILRIEPRDRTTVLKECLKQIGDSDESGQNQRLLEYIARYLQGTLEELKEDGESSAISLVDELTRLLQNARLVPCTDKTWQKPDICVSARDVALKLHKQGWKGPNLDALLTKLLFPKIVAKYDLESHKVLNSLGIDIRGFSPYEIPLAAIQSESSEFTLADRAKVIIDNKENLPRNSFQRASIIGSLKCPSLGGRADLQSLILIDANSQKLPIKVIRYLFPETADIPAIAREWNQTETDTKELLLLFGVRKCKPDEINSRMLEVFPALWGDIDDKNRIAVLEFIGERKDLASQIRPHVDKLEMVLVQEGENNWRPPTNSISPKWAKTCPPNLPLDQLPKHTEISDKVISLWNEWCGIKSTSDVVEAVVNAIKALELDKKREAWNKFIKWLEQAITGPDCDEVLNTLEDLEWVLCQRGNNVLFLRSSEAINHLGAKVLSAKFWVVDTKLPRLITNNIGFKSIPENAETISDIADCLSRADKHSPQAVYQVYKLVDELCGQDEGLKNLWIEIADRKAVYRLMREPELMATGLELFLGEKEQASDYGNILWCFSEKAKGENKFLKNIMQIYRILGVKDKPTVLHAVCGLSKIKGNYSDQKKEYSSLVNLLTINNSQQYTFENELINKIRILTCAETLERLSEVYLDSELNIAELLSEQSRPFIVNNKNRPTASLIYYLSQISPETIKRLGDVAEIEFTRQPQSVEVSKSTSIALGPWKDWFEQLAFEGSDFRDRFKSALKFDPPDQIFKLSPVDRLSIKYRLPDGKEIIPSEKWFGPHALHDFDATIFVLKHEIETDFLGNPKKLELFDSKVAEQVGKLLYKKARPQEKSICQPQEFIKITCDIVKETLERPSVVLDRLRKGKQDHIFHQYQDQSADPEFSDLFEQYQKLSSTSPIAAEVEDKMKRIIKDRFLDERRQQIKGYGYDEFSIFAELIQNAEDAYLQSGLLELDQPAHKKVTFEYRKDDFKKKILIVEHFGRPFNLWRHGTKEIPAFKRDVEGVLKSAGSFKPHMPDISNNDKPIGRFGLGFKSVYLITKKPRIHSGHWHFEIDAACIPFEVLPPKDLRPGATRFVLPLAEGVSEEHDQTGERLVNLMPFLRQVVELELKNSNGSIRRIGLNHRINSSLPEKQITVEWVELAEADHVRAGKVTFFRVRNQVKPAQLGLYIDPEGLPAHWESGFKSDIYAVLPLRTHLGCGLGVSHLFELQSGRTHLTDLVGNQELFKDIAYLIQALPEAFNACAERGKPLGEIAIRFWSFLRWNQGDKDAEQLEKAIATALVRLTKNSRIVPTLNPRKCTSMNEQAVFCFTGIPGEFQEEIVQQEIKIFVGNKAVSLKRDNVVSERFRRAYERTVRVSGMADEANLTEIGWNEIGEILRKNNLLAERPNLLTAMARSLPDEDVRKVKPWLSECLFKTEDESLHRIDSLVPYSFSGMNHLPMNRLNRLHNTYDEDSVMLLKKVGLPSRPSINDIERWVKEGLSGEEGLGLLRYLNEAGHWRRHYHRIGKLLREPWFEACHKRMTSREAHASGFIPHDIVTDAEFRAWLGIFEEGAQPVGAFRQRSETDVKRILENIHRWWENEGSAYSRRYEERIYPGSRMPQLKGEFFEKEGVERRGWLTLFILGCTYTMGWADLRKQKTFLETCEKRGWMDVFSNPTSSANDWIDILDDYLNAQIEDAKWYYWMKQFISIYQISNHLATYINSFLSIEYRDTVSLDLVTRSGIDSERDRGGDIAPDVSRALGIGASFVLRELMRTELLTNNKAFPHCYVPVKRVRDLFIEEFGCRELLFEERMAASKVIYDLLVKHLGKDRATFNRAFDLPFLIMTENQEIKNKCLKISA